MPLNWALTELYYSDAPWLTRVIAFSNHPCHITCWRTRKEPIFSTTSRIVRGIPLWCIPHFKLFGANPHEQNESGDTLHHTFDISNWLLGNSYYLIFVATISGDPTASVGPIVTHIGGFGEIESSIVYPTSDAFIFGDFTEVPPGSLHFWIVSQQPPGYDSILLRSEQTAGPFPNPGHGDFFNFPKLSSPVKYALIASLRFHPIVRRYHDPFIWNCVIPIASYLSQFRLFGIDYYGLPRNILSDWQAWSTLYDFYDESPATHTYWQYWELDDLQCGFQMIAPCSSGSRIYTDITSFPIETRYWKLSS